MFFNEILSLRRLYLIAVLDRTVSDVAEFHKRVELYGRSKIIRAYRRTVHVYSEYEFKSIYKVVATIIDYSIISTAR